MDLTPETHLKRRASKFCSGYAFFQPESSHLLKINIDFWFYEEGPLVAQQDLGRKNLGRKTPNLASGGPSGANGGRIRASRTRECGFAPVSPGIDGRSAVS